jgi:hypothetical protein
MGGNARKLGTAYSARRAAYPLGGKLRLNKARLKAEAGLNGKYLISTTDDYLSIQPTFRTLPHENEGVFMVGVKLVEFSSVWCRCSMYDPPTL